MKTNDVRPGMQLRGKIDGKVYTAVSHIGGQDWRDQDGDVRPFGVASNYEPIPEPAPELCAFPGCATKEHDGQIVHTAQVSPELAVTMCPCRGRRDHVDCHPFVAPQAKPVLREPMTIGGIPVEPRAAEKMRKAATKPGCRLGVACKVHAPAIEPWRPTVDDWDLLADAETGWRR